MIHCWRLPSTQFRTSYLLVAFLTTSSPTIRALRIFKLTHRLSCSGRSVVRLIPSQRWHWPKQNRGQAPTIFHLRRKTRSFALTHFKALWALQIFGHRNVRLNEDDPAQRISISNLVYDSTPYILTHQLLKGSLRTMMKNKNLSNLKLFKYWIPVFYEFQIIIYLSYKWSTNSHNAIIFSIFTKWMISDLIK